MAEGETKKREADAKSDGFEAGISELDYKMRLREFNMIVKMDKEVEDEQ